MRLSKNRYYKKFQSFFSRHEEPAYKEMLGDSKNEIIDQESRNISYENPNIKLFARFFGFLLILPIAIILILSLLVNSAVLKSNLQIILDKKIEGDFMIEGDVETRFLLSPKIIINKPVLKNATHNGHKINVTMDAMVINVGFFSLFSANPKVSELHLISPVVNYSLENAKNTENSTSDSSDKAIEKIEQKIISNFLTPNPSEEKNLNDQVNASSNLEEQDLEAIDEVKSPLEEQDLNGVDQTQSPLEEKDLDKKTAQKNSGDKIDEVKNSIKTQELVYNNSSLTSRIFQFDKNENQLFNIKEIPVIEVVNGIFKKTGVGNEVILDIKNINFISESDIESQDLDIAGEVFFNNIPTQFNLSLNVGSGSSELTVNSTIFQLK